MGRFNKDEDRIRRLFVMNGMAYTRKTCANIRTILDVYASLKSDLDYLPKEKNGSILSSEVANMFRAMIASGKLQKNDIEGFIGVVMRSGHLQEMIDDALEMVKEFSDYGATYHRILYKLYFCEKPVSNNEIEKILSIAHTTFQKKKELAVMLFGVLFWKEMLEYWDNSIEEMYRIEMEEGLDGSLSEGRKEFIEKRSEGYDRRKEGSDRRKGAGDRRKGDRRIGGDRRSGNPAYGV